MNYSIIYNKYDVLRIIQEYRFPPLYQTTLLGDTSELGEHEWSSQT